MRPKRGLGTGDWGLGAGGWGLGLTERFRRTIGLHFKAAQAISEYVSQATTATLLLVDIRKVRELLGHRHITTTQVYDKRRITTSQSASHEVPI